MWRCLIALVASILLVGCGDSLKLQLNSPEKLTLYSIDGRDTVAPSTTPDGKPIELFHNYLILGQVELTDPKQRQILIAAFQDAIARRPSGGMSCFWPRHGIRAVENGHSIEYLICFECQRFVEIVNGNVTLDGERENKALLRSDVQPTFDNILTDAGIPLGPKH